MKGKFTDAIRDDLEVLELSFEQTQRTGQVEWDKVFHTTEHIRKELALFEGALVNVLRTFGKSWAEIGDDLGITRQAAWERFRHYVQQGQAGPTAGDRNEELSS